MIDPFAPEHLRIARKAAQSVAAMTRCYFAIGDMCQRAVVRLETAARSCPPGTAFPAWAERSCRNAAAAELRVLRGPAPVVLTRLGAEDGLDHSVEEWEHQRERRALAAAVRRVLARLPQADRVLFVRHHADGETCRTLATERGVTHQAVSERLRRILERVRQALRVELGDAFPTPTRCSPATARRQWRRGRRAA